MIQFLSEEGTSTLDPEYVKSLGSVDRVMQMNRALVMKPAVASWIRSVDERSRGQLLDAVQAWEQRHTDLLIAELSAQLEGSTIVQGIQLGRISRARLLSALSILNDGKNAPLTAVSVGLSLMQG
jgi:hypothetical protein